MKKNISILFVAAFTWAIVHSAPVRTENNTDTSAGEIQRMLSKVSTSNISDAMEHKGVLKDIHAIEQGTKIVGTAFTVRTCPGDWAKSIEAIDRAEKGQVLVIDANAQGPAVWGELATYSANKRQLAGVVINGACRNIPEIRKMKFPVFCKETMPNTGNPAGIGKIGVPLLIGKTKVVPGDWIVGDDSGVVSIPKDKVEQIARRALCISVHEKRILHNIKEGSSLTKELAKEQILGKIKFLQTKLSEFQNAKPKRSEEKNQLDIVRKQYALLCKDASEGIVMTTLDGKIIEANQAYIDMTGYTLRQLERLTYQQLTPDKWHDMEREMVSLAMNDDFVHFEKEYRRKNGTVFPVLLTGWIIKDKAGKPVGTGSFVIDTTVWQ